MSARRSRIAWVVAAILAVQLAVPAYSTLTSEEHQPRFGWNMFRSVVRLPTVIVETRTGREEVRFREYVPEPRGEIDYAERVGPVICDHRPNVVAVEIRRSDQTRVIHRCR